MGKVDIDTLTIEQYLALTRGNQASGVVKPTIRNNVNFEIKSQFMRELREDTFLGNNNDDAHEHVERVLDIVSLFSIPRATHDAIMLCIFLITLTCDAKRWIDRIPSGTINTWDLLEKAFIQRYCPPSKTTKQLEEIHNFKQEGDETLHEAWERYSRKSNCKILVGDSECRIPLGVALLCERRSLKECTKEKRAKGIINHNNHHHTCHQQLKALINQGIADALAAHDADRSMNGDDSHNSGTGGTEGVVELTQWFEKMETVFRISNCSVENQIKFSTCTILGSALTWWNSYVRTVGHDVAYVMTWTDLKKKMTDKYCPRSEIKKLEVEIMFPEESDKVKKYVGGLPDMLHGSVVASKPKTMQDAIEIATELMDKKIPYAAETDERKEYARTLPLCNKCKFHHNGQCTVKCVNCKKVGHLTQDCRSPAATNNKKNLTFYECGNPGHYGSDCTKLKNKNHRNQAEGTGARGLVHAIGGGEIDQDLNDMEDDISA
ncbi:reverse transcriptase domain-containing protein [Tanacetum coccineum]